MSWDGCILGRGNNCSLLSGKACCNCKDMKFHHQTLHILREFPAPESPAAVHSWSRDQWNPRSGSCVERNPITGAFWTDRGNFWKPPGENAASIASHRAAPPPGRSPSPIQRGNPEDTSHWSVSGQASLNFQACSELDPPPCTSHEFVFFMEWTNHTSFYETIDTVRIANRNLCLP